MPWWKMKRKEILKITKEDKRDKKDARNYKTGREDPTYVW